MKINRQVAIYPGSFDPPTKGHIDLIRRAARIFPKVIVAVTNNTLKNPVFTVEERKKMLEDSLKDLINVKVMVFSGLLVDFMKKNKANIIIRGLRAFTDFEYELQMAIINRKLNKEIDTIFLVPDEKYSYISSSIVKEINSYNGDIGDFVPEVVEKKLKKVSDF